MKVKAVLFDLDGTLIDSIPLIRLTFEKVFEDFKIPWANGEVLKTIGIPLRQVAEKYAPGRVEEFLEKYSSFQQKKQREFIKLFPGTKEVLKTIKGKGCLMGLVTSKRSSPTMFCLTHTEIKDYFDAVITAEDVNTPKPDGEPVTKALKLLNARPEEAVYVGDSWYDIIAGKKARVLTVGVTWGMATHEQLIEHSPDFIASSWEEMLSILF